MDQSLPDPRLRPLLLNLQGTCWWCGQKADSREHRHKRTDLQRMFDKDSALEWHKSDERSMIIRSATTKSKAARFGRVLCQKCNNDRSQSFDKAYDVFSNYLIAHMDELWDADGLDLTLIFGDAWQQQATHLAKYYCKNFGCAMADTGVRPPGNLVSFMDGKARLSSVSLTIVSSESHYWGHRKITKLGLGPNDSLWRPGAVTWMDGEMTELNGYLEISLIGYVGVRFEWHEGWGEQDSFFLHPQPVINRLRLTRLERLSFRVLDARNAARRAMRRMPR